MKANYLSQSETLFNELDDQTLQAYINNQLQPKGITCESLVIERDKAQILHLELKKNDFKYATKISVQLVKEVFAAAIEQLYVFKEATFHEINISSKTILLSFITEVIRQYYTIELQELSKINFQNCNIFWNEKLESQAKDLKTKYRKLAEIRSWINKREQLCNFGSLGEQMVENFRTSGINSINDLLFFIQQKEKRLQELRSQIYKPMTQFKTMPKSILTQVKSVTSPPPLLNVLFSCLMMVQDKDPSWQNIRKEVYTQKYLNNFEANFYNDAENLSKSDMQIIKKKLLKDGDPGSKLKNQSELAYLFYKILASIFTDEFKNIRALKIEIDTLIYLKNMKIISSFSSHQDFDFVIHEMRLENKQHLCQNQKKLELLRHEFKQLNEEIRMKKDQQSRSSRKLEILASLNTSINMIQPSEIKQNLKCEVAIYNAALVNFGMLLSPQFLDEFLYKVQSIIQSTKNEFTTPPFTKVHKLYSKVYNFPLENENINQIISVALLLSKKPKIIYDPLLLGKKSFLKSNQVVSISFHSKSLIKDIEGKLKENKICFIYNTKLPLSTELLYLCQNNTLCKNIYFQTYSSKMNVSTEILEEFMVLNFNWPSEKLKEISQEVNQTKFQDLQMLDECYSRYFETFGEAYDPNVLVTRAKAMKYWEIFFSLVFL